LFGSKSLLEKHRERQIPIVPFLEGANLLASPSAQTLKRHVCLSQWIDARDNVLRGNDKLTTCSGD